MRAAITRLLFLIATTVFLSSCATTSLIDTWHTPNPPVKKLQKLLVVGIFKNAGNRRVYEEVLVGELGKHGIEAVPGYTLIPGSERMGRQALESAVKKAGADGVLTMQTIRVEEKTVVEPGYAEVYPDYWYPSAFPRWDLYEYSGSMIFYEPPQISSYEIAKIQVNLFDSRNGKLLWAATIQTSEPGNIVSVSKDLADIVVRSLVRESLV